jgi:Domain of unknown function (DUF4388)
MGLKGDLGELPLADLVEMTSIGGKTGRLVLFDEEDAVAGVLLFRGGRLVGARSGELAAERAFFALLGLKTGSFDFDPTAELEEEDVDLPTQSLLIEGMRRLDETRRLHQRLPAPAVVHAVGGEAEDALEARILAHLGPGAHTVGDVVEELLVGGDVDEYDALDAVRRLAVREVVRIERPPDVTDADPSGEATST